MTTEELIGLKRRASKNASKNKSRGSSDMEKFWRDVQIDCQNRLKELKHQHGNFGREPWNKKSKKGIKEM